MTESPITPGPFTAPDRHEAIRAQIETLNAITAYYASITATPAREFPEYTLPVSYAAKAKRGAEILRKLNEEDSREDAAWSQIREHTKAAAKHGWRNTSLSGGVVYPTKVEMITVSNLPVAAITFAWNPEEAHHLGRNEVLELRDQLSRFLVESGNLTSPGAKP